MKSRQDLTVNDGVNLKPKACALWARDSLQESLIAANALNDCRIKRCCDK